MVGIKFNVSIGLKTFGLFLLQTGPTRAPPVVHVQMHQHIGTCADLGSWQERHDRLRDLSQTLLLKNGKLVHRRLTVVSRTALFSSGVAQGQPDQLRGRRVIGEVPPAS